MTAGAKQKWGDLSDIHPWEGEQLTLGEIVKREKCPAYSEHFVRRAVVDGGVQRRRDFAAWENEMIRRQREANRRVAKGFRSRFLVAPRSDRTWRER